MLVQKYDKEHDILHIYFSNRYNEFDVSAVEEAPNFFVLRDDITDKVIGLKILDIKKRLEEDS